MSRQYHQIRVVGLTAETELKPLKPGRSYLLVENRSTGAVYLNFDTHADSVNGIEIASGGNYEREVSVPDNVIFIKGTAAANDQVVNISEGYD